ncbi:MAG: type VI secretion system protein TssA [Acidobacteria bacterium]|nr:type VI secretion system protein TssA [Acidobacteriota bacterium]
MSAQAGIIPRTPEAVDVAAQLAPIPGDNPAGESLRYAPLKPGGNKTLYDEVKEARRSDDISSYGDWETKERKTADWKLVIELTTEALATRTKDIQVCSWLCEALVKVEGFAGLRDGLKVMRGLHELYWDRLYPELRDGSPVPRANMLGTLNNDVTLAVQGQPVAYTTGGGSYSYHDWQEAAQFDIPESLEGLDQRRLDDIEKLKARAAEQGKITTEDWRKATKATGPDFYEKTYVLLGECREELSSLSSVADEKYGVDAPSLSALGRVLDDLHSLVEEIVTGQRPPELPPPPPPPPGPSNDKMGRNEEMPPAARPVATGPVQTRQDALNRLAEAAEYFRIHEPHSPISYLVQRAINWSKMPLEAWLKEVIKDGSVLGGLRETLGLKPDDGKSSDEK